MFSLIGLLEGAILISSTSSSGMCLLRSPFNKPTHGSRSNPQLHNLLLVANLPSSFSLESLSNTFW